MLVAENQDLSILFIQSPEKQHWIVLLSHAAPPQALLGLMSHLWEPNHLPGVHLPPEYVHGNNRVRHQTTIFERKSR